MTLEEIKKGLEFTNAGWNRMTKEEQKELAYIVIEIYQKACKELLKIVEDK